MSQNKTKQSILAHASVFVLFSPLHTIALSFENGDFLIRFSPIVQSRLINLAGEAKTPLVLRPETVDPVVYNFVVVASSDIRSVVLVHNPVVVASSDIRSVVLVISPILRYLKKKIIETYLEPFEGHFRQINLTNQVMPGHHYSPVSSSP